MISSMFLRVLELSSQQRAQCHLLLMGKKQAEIFFFSFHSSFIACFRDSTKKCALTICIDIQKSSLCMPDTNSSVQYHKLQWLLASAEKKKWRLRSGLLAALSPHKLWVHFIQVHHCFHNSLALVLISFCVYAELDTLLQLTLLWWHKP